MSRWLRNAVVIAVLIAWVVNACANLFIDGYETPPALNVAFMSVIGAVVYSYRVDDDRKDKSKEDGGDEPVR